MQKCAFSLNYRNKKCTRFFKAAFYLGSISAVSSSPVFDPAGSFPEQRLVIEPTFY